MYDHLNIRVANASVPVSTPAMPPSLERGYLLKVLTRRKGLIVATILGCALLAALVTQVLPQRYTAVLKLAFETRGQPVGELQGNASAAQDEAGAVAGILNEVEILKSRELAEKVIDQLHLDDDPVFNPALSRSSGWLSGIEVLPWLRRQLPEGWLTPGIPLTAEQRAAKQRADVVKRFENHLEVKQVGRSKVFNVTFTAPDPALAAKVVDTLGDAYFASRYEERLANARRASEWLASNVQQLRNKVLEAERNVEAYRRQHDLFQGDKSSLVAAQIADLNLKLIDATASRLAAEAEAAQARRLLGRSDDTDALVQILNSGLIQGFRGELVGIERREAEMSEKFGPRHPQMIQLAAEKQRLKDALDAEVKKIVRGLESKAEAARIREAAFAKDLNGLKQQGSEANTASIALRGLEREAEANRLLLEKFMAAFIESSAREDARSVAAYARIISRPAIPDEPSFPQPGLIMLLAVLAGLVASLPLAAAAEAMDAGFRSAHQVEHDLGVPVLAHVPAGGSGSKARRRKQLTTQVLDHPASVHADAIRSIYNKLAMASFGHLPRSIALTSAEANEGKSTTALSLVRMLANTGHRVLLIDADLHRSHVADTLQLALRPGLTELLSGAAALEQVIQRDPRTSADVIVAGQRQLNASDLLATPTFPELLRQLENRYETIVIDTPPLMALTDALFLANAAAATVMVVRWGATRREVVKYAAMQLATATKRFEGIVLTQVHLKSHARYGFGDSA
ncbi:MAG: polysaccharide biosynthesis tyrosine autokinase, partial [Rhodospirillales bacterium]|nr:polysaccharide biosynthesis tyrosine autokinase [Rhodospirillales bacterium]